MKEKDNHVVAEFVGETLKSDDNPIKCAQRRDWAHLRELSIRPGGFGEYRSCIWPILMHVKDSNDTSKTRYRRNKSEPRIKQNHGHSSSQNEFDSTSEKYENTPSDVDIKHPDEHQIKLDTDRSFVLYSVDGHTDREKLQAELNQLITSVFRRHPKLGYFQGYHDIMTVLYLTLPEDVQLQCAEKLSLHRLRDAMGKGLEPLLGLLQFLKFLLRQVDSKYSALLERSAPLPYFALSNLLTLFSHDVPTLSLIQHIFDYLLCRPPIAAVYLEAAIVLSRREEAFRLEQEGEEGMLHSLLSSLPELVDGSDTGRLREKQTIRTTDDGDNLVKKEISGPVIEETLDEAPLSENLDSDIDLVSPVELPISDSLDHSDSEPSRILQDEQVNPPDAVLATVSNESCENHLKEYVSDTSEPSETKTESEEEKEETQSTSHTLPGSSILSDLSSADLDSSRLNSPVISRPASRSSQVDYKEDMVAPLLVGSSSHRGLVLALPSLLARADELMAQFPPNHPDLHLDDILGPQSVIFTWSEDPRELATDAEAETMVIRPDLVVHPFVDPAEENNSSDSMSEKSGGGKGRSRSRRRERRRLHRLKHPHFGVQIDRKTVLTGAVVALGVAVAVYQIRSKENGASVLENLGSDVSRAERALKKVAKLFGGVFE